MNHPCAPILSVITPTFNSLPFIEECILHVESERIDGVEHVIVDGASTDGTEALISKLAKSRPYVSWISEPDTGQSSAMNRGIALAKGRFICFLNVDDYFEPACLKLVVSNLLKLSENQFLVGNCNVVNGRVSCCRSANHLNVVTLKSCSFGNPTCFRRIPPPISIQNLFTKWQGCMTKMSTTS